MVETRQDDPTSSTAEAIPGEGSRFARRLVWPMLGISMLAVCLTAPHYLSGEARNPSEIFQHLFVTQELFGALLAASIVLLAWLLGRRAGTFWPSTVIARINHRPWILIAATFLLLLVSTRLVYHQHPLSLDEYAPVFQAEVFAAGELWAEFPPPLIKRLIPAWFINRFWAVSPEEGRVISGYWPGFALLLTPWAKLGTPWVLNPLLGAGSLFLLWILARRLSPDSSAAGWAVCLAIASPELLVNAVSYYSMTAHLFMNLLFVVLLLEPTRWRLFAAGAVGSIALVLHQPIPHALVALPWLVHFAWRRDRWRTLPFIVVGYLPMGMVLGLGWFYLRASFQADWTAAVRAAVPALAATAEAPKSGLQASLDFFGELAASLIRVPDLEWIVIRLKGYLKLFLWAVPGLPLLAWMGYRSWRGERTVRLIGASVACTVVGYLLMPVSQGHGWGFRYFHQLWWVMPLLAGLAVAQLDRRHPAWGRQVGYLVLLSLVLSTALRFSQVEGFIARHLAQRPSMEADQHQVCFLYIAGGYYAQDLVQNDPFLRDPNLVLVSFGRERDEELIRRLFPSPELVYDDGENTVWQVEPAALPP